ncbi:hypothetical protein [Okeania sp. SIO2B3]|nr:hypothetical protein [Okeania sp. SIO2B3]
MQDSKPYRFFRASQNAFFGSSQLSGAIAYIFNIVTRRKFRVLVE